MIPLSDEQEQMIGRGLSQLPLADRDRAVDFILSVLLREVADSDVRHAVCAALVKYGVSA